MSSVEALPQLDHPIIDTLHHEAELLLSRVQHTPDNELAMLLDTLYDHCVNHFSTEEQLMIESGYRGLSEHRHEHRRLLGEMEVMKQALARGKRMLVRSWLRERLPEWFHLHVNQLDAQMVVTIGGADVQGSSLCAR